MLNIKMLNRHKKTKEKKGDRKGKKKTAKQEPITGNSGNKIKNTTEKLLETEEKLKDCEDASLRLMADFENYKKHIKRESEEFKKYSNSELIKELLNIVDNFDRAYDSIKEKDTESAEGIGMIKKQLMELLKRYDVRAIDAAGKKFDPAYHEAMMQKESEMPEGTIIEEFQKGYIMNSCIIRHSMVAVSSGIKNDTKCDTQDGTSGDIYDDNQGDTSCDTSCDTCCDTSCLCFPRFEIAFREICAIEGG